MPGCTASSIWVSRIPVDWTCKWRAVNLFEAGDVKGCRNMSHTNVALPHKATCLSKLTMAVIKPKANVDTPPIPRGHQGHLEIQKILTQRSFTSITCGWRCYGHVVSKCSTYSSYRHFVLQYLLGVCHSASNCCSVYQECLSSSLAASWTPSPGHHMIPRTISGITIFWLGPWTQQGRGAHREYSGSMLWNMGPQGSGYSSLARRKRLPISLAFGSKSPQL